MHTSRQHSSISHPTIDNMITYRICVICRINYLSLLKKQSRKQIPNMLSAVADFIWSHNPNILSAVADFISQHNFVHLLHYICFVPCFCSKAFILMRAKRCHTICMYKHRFSSISYKFYEHWMWEEQLWIWKNVNIQDQKHNDDSTWLYIPPSPLATKKITCRQKNMLRRN